MPHRSRLSILLLDLPPEHHAAGTAFWAGATYDVNGGSHIH